VNRSGLSNLALSDLGLTDGLSDRRPSDPRRSLPGSPWMSRKNRSCQRAGRSLMLSTLAMKSA
jgi:hypothetical protein